MKQMITDKYGGIVKPQLLLASAWKRMSRLLRLGLILICLIGGLNLKTAYASVPEDVTFSVTQDFVNTDSSVPVTETFTYWLRPALSSNPMPAGSVLGHYAFDLTGDEVFDIGPIHFTTPGTYTYYLSCIISAVPNYHYDRQIYTIDIHVFSAIDGWDAVVIIKNTNNDKVNEVGFQQFWGLGLLDPDAMVDPPVQKTVDVIGDEPPMEAVFTFRLTAEDASYPMPAGSVGGVKTIQIAGSGSMEFGTWSYVNEGVFRYTVSELDSGVRGYTYDTEMYTISDDVRFIGSHLIVTRTITNRAGGQTSALAYRNRYESPVSETVTISGSKTWRYGSEAAALHPQSITVVLLADGTAVAQRRITSADNWSWSFVVDRFDSGGHEIVYTIDELAVSNYTKAVFGYNIINTYVPPPPPSPPVTGDDSQAATYRLMFNIAGVAALLSIGYLMMSRLRGKNMAVVGAGEVAGSYPEQRPNYFHTSF